MISKAWHSRDGVAGVAGKRASVRCEEKCWKIYRGLEQEKEIGGTGMLSEENQDLMGMSQPQLWLLCYLSRYGYR